jgi:hypothetical protein
LHYLPFANADEVCDAEDDELVDPTYEPEGGSSTSEDSFDYRNIDFDDHDIAVCKQPSN